jgi:GxxExxY protein
MVHAENAKLNKRKARKEMTENEIATKVIGISIELHKKLGPGLLESAYEHALQYDLIEAGLKVERQVPMPFI